MENSNSTIRRARRKLWLAIGGILTIAAATIGGLQFVIRAAQTPTYECRATDGVAYSESGCPPTSERVRRTVNFYSTRREQC
jgi:hypothetical protein